MHKRGDRRKNRKSKERFTVRVHPLFLLFGLFFFVRGEIFLFLSCTVTAVIHEFGHALAAARLGRRLDRLVLLPCGAVVSGDIEGISLAGEIRLALAGPAVNAACALFFVALWWLFPDLYPYTDTAAYTSAWLAAVNLLPAWPLDGGRVLFCILEKKFGEGRARRAARAVSILFAAAFFSLFVYSFFVRVNFSLLFFGLFILAGAFGKGGSYRRIRFDRSADLARGLEIRRVAVSESCPVGRLLRLVERGKYLEVSVYDASGEFMCELGEEECFEIFDRADLSAPLGVFLGSSLYRPSASGSEDAGEMEENSPKGMADEDGDGAEDTDGAEIADDPAMQGELLLQKTAKSQ